QRRGSIVILADKIARAYVPVVHFLAATAFVFWLSFMATSLPHALEITIAVLVITCPCALALAVPVVQVLASTKLMQQGILIKSPAALERLAEIDTVVFDKTGTLTLPDLVPDISGLNDDQKAVALAMASASHHPLARALAQHLNAPSVVLANIQEVAGEGLCADSGIKLGRAAWVGAKGADQAPAPELWLALPHSTPVRIPFRDQLRPDATATIQRLKDKGLNVILLSGDRAAPVAKTALAAGMPDWHADMRPAAKATFLQQLETQGRKVMMVGDGLNDGPALANAHISLSPASGADIAQTTADIVFQRQSLKAVTDLLDIAGKARRLAHQNIGFALAYNIVAIPLAMAGLITPLWAALAMSASSLTVTANAFRLSFWRAS
ncbi:MAG: HAD-IC family P-type ATPase, partial [Alphaproteobacteria bacterium]